MKERDFIVDNDFDALWDLLWLNKHSKQYQNEYNNSKKNSIVIIKFLFILLCDF